MILRGATAAHADSIAALHADSWRRTYRGMMSDEFLDNEVVQDRLSVWRERFRTPKPNQHVIVADEAGDIHGFICIFGDDDARWGSFVDNLHVRHDVHTHGIGRKLMREAATWAEANYPGRGVYLWVMEANHNAQGFYDRLGGTNEGLHERDDTGGGTVRSLRYAWRTTAALTTDG